MDPDRTKVGRNWERDVQPYIKNTQVYGCPNAILRSDISAGSAYAETTDPKGANASYLLNGLVSSQPLAVIPTPADTIFVQEYLALSRVSQVRPCPNNSPPTLWYQFNHPYYDRMHPKGSLGASGSGGNLLFCDGHAKWLKKTAIKFKQFGADTSTLANPDQTFADSTAGENTDNAIKLPSLFPPPPL